MNNYAVTVPTDRFVYFDQNGEILKITNYRDDNEQYIMTSFDSVKNLISGKDHFFDYAVSYDLKTKGYMITKKSKSRTMQDSISDRMYKIPSGIPFPDLTILQDINNGCWVVTINEELLKNSLTNRILNQSPLIFSITKKDSPNQLYRSFELSISPTPTVVPFKYDTENSKSISIYTVKRLNSYNYEVSDEQKI